MEKTKPVTKTALQICSVCAKSAIFDSNSKGCPYRCLGNDYCPDILNLDSQLYDFFKKKWSAMAGL